ncbi:MAG: DUF1642 domain-containing protein [Lactococcus lactis]|jgi:hypothetical protein|nr:DUF1642 domain-containing protein [Lactococcus lactis]MCI2139070.1 DUF1642 domain-containing protein [Lactococcus lactis]MCI2188853.1 DUF1642 domain-containing protein [Lactococcus lactis]
MTKFEEELKETYEKVSINLYGNNAGSIGMKKLLNELKDTGLLKEQQALPVVPDFIGKLINTFGAPEDGKYINYSASYLENQKELDWIDNHQKTWLTALLIGFTVEKPQLFYLREKNTGFYLNKSKNNGLELVPNPYFDEDNQFTQQEIGSMETGSYEQIEVAE